MTLPPGPVDARVLQTPHGFKVLPNDVFKHVADGFTLLNMTGTTVHVSFQGLPTTPPDADVEPDGRQTFTILETPPGIYDYWVELALKDSNLRTFTLRASAGSDPHIIIDF